MTTHRIARLLTLIAALVCGPVMAYPENPFLTPEHPTTDDAIVINAYSGPCDLLQHSFEDPVVTVAGDEVTVLLSGEHYADPIYCLFAPRIEQVDIGTLPAGSYTIAVNWRFAASSGPTILQLGVLPLAVGGTAADEPVPLPTSNVFSLVALALMLLAVVAMEQRGRRNYSFEIIHQRIQLK